jgi:hypothetical protein
LPKIPDHLVYPGISLPALPLMSDFRHARCCKVRRRCRRSTLKTTPPGWRFVDARSRSAALASSDDAGPPYSPAHEIPDFAANSGIIRRAIPMLNGSKCANEHFSGCFRQSDTGFLRQGQSHGAVPGNAGDARHWLMWSKPWCASRAHAEGAGRTDQDRAADRDGAYCGGWRAVREVTAGVVSAQLRS